MNKSDQGRENIGRENYKAEANVLWPRHEREQFGDVGDGWNG